MEIIVAAVTVSLLWGSGWLFMKLGVSVFPPLLFAGVRGVLAGAVLLLLFRWQRRPWPPRDVVMRIAAVGVLMTGVANGVTFWGQARISSSLAALVWCAMPFCTAIFSHILLPDQKLTPWRVGGLMLGFSGVWLVLSTQHLDIGAGTAEGKAAILISAVLWALTLVLTKRYVPPTNSILMTGAQLLAGGIFLVPIGLAVERTATIQLTPMAVGVFLMMLFGQGVIAYLCYYDLLGRVSPTSVSLLSFVTPSIAVMLGVLLLGEPLYWQMIAGLGLVAVGILTVNLPSKHQPTVAS